MARVMSETAGQTAERINGRLAGLLEEARGALRGEHDFDVEDVRRLSELVAEMDPIVLQAAELRRLQPEIVEHLDCYKSQLGELQTCLVQIQVMLLSRVASLQAGQVHTTAMARWVSAYGQTR